MEKSLRENEECGLLPRMGEYIHSFTTASFTLKDHEMRPFAKMLLDTEAYLIIAIFCSQKMSGRDLYVS